MTLGELFRTVEDGEHITDMSVEYRNYPDVLERVVALTVHRATIEFIAECFVNSMTCIEHEVTRNEYGLVRRFTVTCPALSRIGSDMGRITYKVTSVRVRVKL